MMALTMSLLLAVSTFAGDNKNNAIAIKGKVIDDDGKPADSEIRVKPLDRRAADTVVQTDSRGHYIVTGLTVGTYSVTAYDFSGNARSRAMIKIPRKGWAKVDFDFKLDSMVGDGGNTIDGHDHMWSASSHLGPLPVLR
jgi:hypothetical protein